MRYLLTLNLSIVKKTLIVAIIVTIMSGINLGLNILYDTQTTRPMVLH